MSNRWKWIVGILAVVVVIGLALLSTADPNPETNQPPRGEAQANVPASPACMNAFADAAGVPEAQGAPSDLYPALQACESLADWIDSAEAHPEALDGADPEAFARDACGGAPAEVQESPVCLAVLEG